MRRRWLQALPSADLPPPKSGSYSELSFRRLLKSCDEIAAGDAKGRQDLEDWQHSPVFYQVRNDGVAYCTLVPLVGI